MDYRIESRTQESAMLRETMSTDQVIDALAEIGETGHAKIRRGNELHIQREENGGWWFYGTVADPRDAQQVIDDFFNA